MDVMSSRSPLRISLAGGGTDCPPYRNEYGGMTVGFTIDSYVHVNVKGRWDDKVVVSCPDVKKIETFKAPVDKPDSLMKAVFMTMKLSGGADIEIRSDFVGSGFGTSSAILDAFLVPFFNDKEMIARTACHIEEDVLGNPGYQDQYASAFGGLAAIYYEMNGEVVVEQLRCPGDFTERLVLCSSGEMRESKRFAVDQMKRAEAGETTSPLHRAKVLAFQLRSAIQHYDMDRVGEILDEVWLNKVKLSPLILTDRVSELYNVAKQNGALGCKLMGAGGGGMMILCAQKDSRSRLERSLHQIGARTYRFKVSYDGCGFEQT